jgi:polyferredoxin
MGVAVLSGARWHESAARRRRKERRKMLSTILIVVLVLMVLGAVPAWPYSRGWGYFPSGLLGIVLLVFLILALTGRV